MGAVKRHLYSGELHCQCPDMYAEHRSLEAAESHHFHERNVRLEYSVEEFADLASAFQRAASKPVTGTPEITQYLDLQKIPPRPSVTPRRFDIEESDYPTLPETTIHVHYRSLRLELTHREWEEFAQGVLEAWEAWK